MRLAILILVTFSGACLSENGRVSPDASSTTDTSTTSPNDSATNTTSNDTATNDTQPDTECGSCDDNDDCTYDYCEAGECQHDPLQAFGGNDGVALPGCATNADCVSNDACTEGTCVFPEPGCGGPQPGYCAYTTVPGCGSCAQGCDDNDPCTIDYCVDDLCMHDVESNDCISECTNDGIATVEPGTYYIGQDVKLVGPIAPYEATLTCSDGPDCACVSDVGLGQRDMQILLTPGAFDGAIPTPEPLDAWTCRTSGCNETPLVTCTPQVAAVTYRVWGIAGSSAPIPFSADRADPIAGPPADMVAVAGFCLDTAPASLVGAYQGSVRSNNVEIGFNAAIRKDGQDLKLEVSSPKCQNACPSWVQDAFPQTVTLDAFDNRIGFSLEVPYSSGPVPADITLYSGPTAFSGRWVLEDGNGQPVIGGRVVLTRIGQALTTSE